MNIRSFVILSALVLATAGCQHSKPEKPVAVKTSAPASLPTQDWTRLACHTLPSDMLEQLENLADMRLAGEQAVKSSDNHIAAAGEDILSAVTAHDNSTLTGDRTAEVNANLAISQAGLDMAEACAAKYGEGPW